MGVFEWLFDLGLPFPHGTCLLWRPDLIVLHAGSDVLIAGAYFSIPLGLIHFMRKRRDVAFNWIFGMFAAFILLCGLTHLIEVATIWKPWYGFEGVMKLATAGVSVATAIVIWPLIPRVAAMPSPEQYAGANRRLQKAMDALERSNAELESRVAARTAALEEATRELEIRSREAEEMAEERAVLLREMHHRTGNNLQIISSFVGLTLRGVRDPAAADAIRQIRARLAAITDVNRLLLRSDTLSKGRADDYLQRLTDDLRETLLATDSHLEMETELSPVELSPDKLTYLGLVAVELITNAVKYGFPDERPGRITVRLTYRDGGLVFEVEDDGVGYDPEGTSPAASGAGSAIVRQFAQRLDATVEQVSSPGAGALVRLNIAENREGPEPGATI